MKVKIITVDSSLTGWKSINRKINNIRRTLLTMKNVGDVQVEIIHDTVPVVPVSNGRIKHYFMEELSRKYTKDGEAFIVFHMHEEFSTAVGIQPNLRGSAFNDDNFISEAYFWADENTKRGRYNQFEETCLHEIAHLIFNRNGKPDITHEYHDKYKTIKGLFKQIDYRDYQTGLLDSIVSWFRNKGFIASLTPLVKRKADMVVAEMKKRGYDVHIYEGYRSVTSQNELYAQGRTKPGSIVTNAKGGESLHNYGVAVDIVFGVKGRPSWAEELPWRMLGEVGKMYGFECGGDWKQFTDRPHFQITLGYSLDDFKNKKVNYSKFL